VLISSSKKNWTPLTSTCSSCSKDRNKKILKKNSLAVTLTFLFCCLTDRNQKRMNKNDQYLWQLISSELYSELGDQEQASFSDLKKEKETRELLQKTGKMHQMLREMATLEDVHDKASWGSVQRRIRFNTVKSFSLTALKYAAIVLIALLTGYFLYPLHTGSPDMHDTVLDVPAGQTSHLTLSDGTEVWLNSGSTFRYPDQFNRKERNVYLKGEGFFKVTPDKTMPFKVKTANMEVKVLGTAFNVSSYGEGEKQSVILEEGRVEIDRADGSKPVELIPGQMAERKTVSGPFQVTSVRAKDYTNWKDGIIVFELETLAGISKKLERWYNVEVRFESAELERYRITGTILRNKPVYQITQAIELLAPVEFEYQPRTNQKDLITIVKK
jgi:ferric-dicitrate binding protein FerR (iron transport regulator)